MTSKKRGPSRWPNNWVKSIKKNYTMPEWMYKLMLESIGDTGVKKSAYMQHAIREQLIIEHGINKIKRAEKSEKAESNA